MRLTVRRSLVSAWATRARLSSSTGSVGVNEEVKILGERQREVIYAFTVVERLEWQSRSLEVGRLHWNEGPKGGGCDMSLELAVDLAVG